MKPVIERRQPFVIDEAKFSTQRMVTYFLLMLFFLAAISVHFANDQAERSTMLQTIINFTMLAVGFWLGSSKSAVDKDGSISRIAEASAPVAAAAAAAATATPIKTDEVRIDAQTATVNEAQPQKEAP